MARQVVSRTQRRMEKRQALILLVLVLAVSLVSFTLGVMVGRSGSPEPVVAGSAPSPARLPVVIKEAPPAPAPEAAAERPAEGLTFYDTLPKGEQPPLGSGINLPPREEAKAKEKTSAPEPSPAAVTANPTKAEAQAVSADGGYAVQVASFRQADDALALRKRLAGKAYAAFTEEADLKEKGIWHRVCVGPFASAEAAAGIVEKLQAEEKLTALVKKR